MATFSTPFFQQKSYYIAFFILVISGLVGFEVSQRDRPWPAPEVTFTTLKGEKIALQNLRGKAVLVTFWATDCPSCVKEVNDFIDLYQQFHAKGLEIIAVAMAYDPPNHVVEMTAMKRIPYHVALDLRAVHAQAFEQVEFTPTTFLINPQGQVIFKKVGLFSLADMQNRLQQLLN
jgi:peroxiredoxin